MHVCFYTSSSTLAYYRFKFADFINYIYRCLVITVRIFSKYKIPRQTRIKPNIKYLFTFHVIAGFFLILCWKQIEDT